MPDGKADHPVLEFSLDSATAYCSWLNTPSDSEGWTFRLPTEAEWENAASGPDALKYPWGDAAGTTCAGLVLTSNYNYMAVCAAYELAEHGEESATCTDTGRDPSGRYPTVGFRVAATGPTV